MIKQCFIDIKILCAWWHGLSCMEIRRSVDTFFHRTESISAGYCNCSILGTIASSWVSRDGWTVDNGFGDFFGSYSSQNTRRPWPASSRWQIHSQENIWAGCASTEWWHILLSVSADCYWGQSVYSEIRILRHFGCIQCWCSFSRDKLQNTSGSSLS